MNEAATADPGATLPGDPTLYLAAILDNSYDAILIVDAAQRVVLLNRAAEAMFGYPAGEAVGSRLDSVLRDALSAVPTESAPSTQPSGTAPACSNQPVLVLHRRDGTLFHAQIHVADVPNGHRVVVVAPAGEGTSPSECHGALREDISERQAAEARLMEKEAQYRSIFEASSDGLLIVGLDGRIVEANPAACRMYGYAHDEILHLPITALIQPDYRSRFTDMLGQAKKGESFFSHAVDRRKDGSVFHVEVHGSSFLYAGQPHLLSIVRDVTEQVRSVQLLEQRVAERTHELSTLLAVSHNIAATLDLGTLLDLILDQLRTVVDHDSVILFSLEEGRLRALRYRGLASQEQAHRYHLLVAQTVAEQATVRRRDPVMMGDLLSDEPGARAVQEALGRAGQEVLAHARAWMYVPLTVKEHTIGALTLAHRQPYFYTADHARLALAIASQAASAIENARLYEQGQRLAAMEERQRLARELHDSVSQALYGISLAAHTAQGLHQRGSSQIKEPLDYLLRLADAALAEMRALIFELRPDSLEREGLVSALSKHVAAARARHGLAVDMDLCDEPNLSFPVKEALYRVAQEALNNAIRHAHAKHLDVRLSCVENQVVLSVRDNGVGFDPHGEHADHMGLRSMRERIERINGTCTIESSPGQGTLVQARVQLGVPVAGQENEQEPTEGRLS